MRELAGATLVLCGFVLLVIASVGLVAGRRVRLLPSRRAALVPALAGFLVLALGGATLPPSDDPVAAPRDVAPTAEPSASPTVEPTPRSSAEPSAASSPDRTQPGTAPEPTPSAVRPAGTAAALLATLPVKGRAPMTGYSRDEFGQAWADVDRNGCDTRNDILRRDLADTALKPGTNGCVVLSGESVSDPYTARAIHFVRGGPAEIDIDHVVALGDAWQTGAQQWDVRRRIAFGNDPLNLLAVDSSANRQKGASDAASWLPANKPYRCAYVARQVAVKAKYGLWVTAAEAAANERVRGGRPGLAAPPRGGPTRAPAGRGVVAPPPEPAPEPASAGVDARYPYCKDLPAGLGPYHRGTDPEYAWYRDADGDGVVCE
jgi:hypothetical protein